jgi:lipopolysaccharide/colanic/teichoic acid biosynthesis glycosyltransferase
MSHKPVLPVALSPEHSVVHRRHAVLRPFPALPGAPEGKLLLFPPPSRRWAYFAAKRTLDLAFSLLALALLAPLLLALALLVRCTSRGPILTWQPYAGAGGRIFRLYAFRALYAFSARYAGADMRVTPVGAMLRATGLVALPRLVNVVRGEMSFVGPRPLSLIEVGCCEPRQLACLAARPGIAGAWRLAGRMAGRETALAADRLALDIDYLRRRSLWLDLKLLLALPLVLGQRGR